VIGTALAIGAVLTVRLGLISFHPVSIPDDVPAHLVSALAQDADGFLWIGTQGGLVRYDGYTFRTYRTNPRDPAALGGAYVRALRASADGRLWAGTFADGVSIYDPATDRFTQLRHTAGDASTVAHNRVEGLAEERDGHMWIATYGGLDRFDPRSGAIEHFRHDPAQPSSLADDRTRGILVSRDGRVWVGSSGGLQVWSPATRAFERAGAASGPESLAGTFVSELYEDARGRIWIGTTGSGAAVWDPESRRLQRFPPGTGDDAKRLSHFWVYGISEGGSGEIWIATFGGGIDVVDADTLGEEFLIVARFNDRREGGTIAEKIREAVAARTFTLPDGDALHVTCSIGFAAFPFSTVEPGALDWERVIDLADLALYEAKRGGRNGWVGFDGTTVADPGAAIDALKSGRASPISRQSR